MGIELRVVEDPAGECARLLHEVATGNGVAGADRPEIVLTGGSTPSVAYQQAAALGGDWTRARLWFSDERCVGPEDELSNYRLVRESLLEPLGERAPEVMRMEGERGFADGAMAYEAALRDAGSPRFALTLLGLGPDSHIASMFPGQGSLSERERLALGVPEAGMEPYVPRITLTMPALANSERIVFLVTGSTKADAVLGAFGPQSTPDPKVPGSMLAAIYDGITVLLDREAAAWL